MQDRSLVERAAMAGLALPGGPSVRAVQLATYFRDRLDRLKAVEATFTVEPDEIEKIHRYLEAVNLDPRESWAYVEHRFEWWGREKIARGRLVTSLQRLGADRLTAFNFRSPYAWADEHRPYHVEMIGRDVGSNDEEDKYPREALWAMVLDKSFCQLAVWRARAIRNGAPTFAQTDWRPGWAAPEPSYGGQLPGNTEAAEVGLALLRDVELRRGPGAPRKTRSKKVNKLAEAGLRWLRAHPGYAVEDVGRAQLAEASGRGRKGLDEHMRTNEIVNDDIHDRMRELLTNSGRAE